MAIKSNKISKQWIRETRDDFHAFKHDRSHYFGSL